MNCRTQVGQSNFLHRLLEDASVVDLFPEIMKPTVRIVQVSGTSSVQFWERPREFQYNYESTRAKRESLDAMSP